MDQHSGAFGKMGESIAEMRSEKEAIVQDVNQKCEVIEGLIRTLNEATTHAVQTLRQSYAGIEDTMTRHVE